MVFITTFHENMATMFVSDLSVSWINSTDCMLDPENNGDFKPNLKAQPTMSGFQANIVFDFLNCITYKNVRIFYTMSMLGDVRACVCVGVRVCESYFGSCGGGGEDEV